MVQYELHVGKEELHTLRDISLEEDIFKKRRKVIAVLYSIIGIGLLLLSIVYMANDGVGFGVLLLVVAILVFAMAFGGVRLIQKRAIMRQMSQMNDAIKTTVRRYTFQEEGVRISSDLGDGNYSWNAFACWGTIDHYLYLRRVDQQVILVDCNHLSEGEYQELINLLGRVPKR